MARTKSIPTPPVDADLDPTIIIPEIIEVIDEAQAASIKSSAIQIVSITDATIEALKAAYAGFKIDGDPERFKEAKIVKNKLVKVRTGVDRRRKELNKLFNDTCNAEAARITSETTPIEAHLATEIDAYEQAEQRRIEERRRLVIDRLLSSGFDFNGVSYVCGDQTIWQLEVDNISDDVLESACVAAELFRQNEATAAAEAARRSAPVYLHQPEVNELIQLSRGEYEADHESFVSSGVIEISKEQYDEIKTAKLAAFRRPAPAVAPAPDPRNSAPEHSPQFMEAPPAPMPIKQNDAFLSQAVETVGIGTDTPRQQLPEFTGAFAPNLNPAPKAPIDAYEQAFDTGYECYRRQVLKAFGNLNDKRSRAEWIEFFKQLTPLS